MFFSAQKRQTTEGDSLQQLTSSNDASGPSFSSLIGEKLSGETRAERSEMDVQAFIKNFVAEVVSRAVETVEAEDFHFYV